MWKANTIPNNAKSTCCEVLETSIASKKPNRNESAWFSIKFLFIFRIYLIGEIHFQIVFSIFYPESIQRVA